MTAWLKQRLPDVDESLLNRLVLWAGGLVVFAVAAFAVFYYLGQQQDRNPPQPIEEHIDRLEQAVRADPGDVGARMALAELYYADDRFADSVDQYRAALKIEAESAQATLGLGRSLLAFGDQAGATASFEEVLALTADDEMPGDLVETAHYYLGGLALEQQRPADAITHLEEALAIDSADADAWHLLGSAYLDNGDLEDAVSALSRATEFVPNFAEAYERLALAYERQGLVPETHYARGMLAFSETRYDEAEQELELALAGSATLVQAHVGLGLVYESLGERDLAVTAYLHAIDLEEDNFNAQSGLARLGMHATDHAGLEDQP